MYTVNLKFNDVSNLVDEHKVHGTEVANNSFVKKWLALKRAFWFLRVVFTGIFNNKKTTRFKFFLNLCLFI